MRWTKGGNAGYRATVEPQRDVYEPLNGLRGIAALAVVIYHASLIMGVQLAPRGYLAVDLFFVLSGFVIAHAYERRFKAGLGPFRFFWRRVRRFYPLYLTGLAIGAGVMALDILRPPAPMLWREYAAAIMAGTMFLPLPFKDLYPLNVPAWSLLCELLVNLIYALIWRQPIVLALVAALSWLLLLTRSEISSPDLLTGMLRACFSFPVGVFIYRARGSIPHWPIPAWLVIGGIGLALVTPFPEMLAVTAVFPIGIALLAKCENRRGFTTLGRLSFPLYAIHWPLLQFGLGLKAYIPVTGVVQGFAWVAAAIIAAWAADRFVDQKIRHWPPSSPRS